MNEPSSPAKAGSTGSAGPDWVEEWEQTSTLTSLRVLTRLSGQVAPTVARRAGLTHNELRALEHLMDQPMGPGELGRLLGVSSAAASGIIDRLESRGHAQRSPHASDARRTAVTISATGRTEVVGYLMPMFRELAALDASLRPEERVAVDRFLQGAIRALRAVT
ncbi:MAG: MarR family winged helix-turn-helix transcriptional regulator [Marmoricola sp.]